MLGRDLADLVLQGDDGVADQVGQALAARASTSGGSHRLERHADRLEGVVGAQRFDGLLAVDGDLASGDFELDLARHQQRGDQIAQRVLRPAEGRVGEVLGQPFAFDRSVALDVVTDADQRLVVGLDAGSRR